MIELAWYELVAIVAGVALVALVAGGAIPAKYRAAVWVAVGFLASVATLGPVRRLFGRRKAASGTQGPRNDTGLPVVHDSKSDALEAIVEGRENDIIEKHDRPLDPGDFPGDDPGDLAKLDQWATDGRD